MLDSIMLEWKFLSMDIVGSLDICVSYIKYALNCAAPYSVKETDLYGFIFTFIEWLSLEITVMNENNQTLL